MRISRKLALRVLGGTCVLGFLAGWVVFMHYSPSGRPRCQVRVSTVEVSNDATGTRYATFGLSNVGQHAVFVLPPYGLQNHSGEWRAELVPKTAKAQGTNLMGVMSNGARRLNPAESCRISLVLPFDDSKWRASFFCFEIWPPLTGEIHALFNRLGWTKGEDGQIVASTDWTEQ